MKVKIKIYTTFLQFSFVWNPFTLSFQQYQSFLSTVKHFAFLAQRIVSELSKGDKCDSSNVKLKLKIQIFTIKYFYSKTD